MKYAVAVSSMTGNGRLLADQIYAHLGNNNCVYFGPLSKDALKADIIYVGFWTDQGTCDKACKEFLQTIHNKKVFLFGTCGFGISDEYFDKVISSSLKNIPIDNEIIGKFICTGKMQQRVKDRYLKLREETKDYERFDMLIKNFDEGQAHPNDEDFKNLIAKL